jgi:predicted ATPase/class 3 adenylate cyclase
MGELPTGTVTFVFTDIEGSTSMLQRLGDGFLAVLEDHNRLMRDALGDGVEIRSEGDAFFYVFSSAAAAVRAACAAQRGLASADWPEGGTVLVRMGIHTGEGVAGGDDYVGLDVHRAARIAAAGHGGQILVSDATRLLSMAAVVDDFTFVDLGEHRLKDLEQAEHIFQVAVKGLPSDFPPIRSLDAAPNNLPTQSTTFIGRRREVDEVRDLLDRHRLVTLTGPSGTGKTRLALQVAGTAQGAFGDGVYYIPLESLSSADLVVGAIAEQLGVTNGTSGPLLDTVIESLRSRAMLLLLDNFEHLVAASTDVAALLGGVPGVKVLATSQRPLRIRGEQAYVVSSLAPQDAVELFMELTSASDRSLFFDDHRPVVEEIVGLLEGSPLALELTAPRVQLFGLTGLRDRLAARLEVPVAGLADLPERHRSLTNAIAWSYDLLDADRRAMLRRLAIFEGGFTLDAAEAVAESSGAAAAGVAELLDRSLLRNRVRRGEMRFSMLESIRRFALDALAGAGEEDDAAARHAAYFAALAEAAGPNLDAAAQQVWFDRLADEHDNLRAALRRSRDTDDPDLGLRTAGSIWRFYHRRGYLREGREWLELLLAMDGSSPEARAVGMEGLAGIRYWQADYAGALQLYEQLLPLYQELGEETRAADTIFALATTSQWLGDLEAGREYAERARAAYEVAGAPHGAARVAGGLAWNAWRSGADLDETLELWIDFRHQMAAIGDDGEVRESTAAISAILYQLGRTEEAIHEASECFAAMVDAGDASGTIMAIDFFATVSAAEHPEESVRLAAAAAALRTEAGGGLSAESVGLEPVRSVVAGVVDAAAFDAAWRAGGALSLEEAVALGREVIGPR